MNNLFTKAVFIAVLLPGLTAAEESGFLEDYSILGEAGQYGAAKMYVSETAIERMVDYDSIMIDQPYIYLDPDSKSKGMTRYSIRRYGPNCSPLSPSRHAEWQ